MQLILICVLESHLGANCIVCIYYYEYCFVQERHVVGILSNRMWKSLGTHAWREDIIIIYYTHGDSPNETDKRPKSFVFLVNILNITCIHRTYLLSVSCAPRPYINVTSTRYIKSWCQRKRRLDSFIISSIISFLLLFFKNCFFIFCYHDFLIHTTHTHTMRAARGSPPQRRCACPFRERTRIAKSHYYYYYPYIINII